MAPPDGEEGGRRPLGADRGRARGGARVRVAGRGDGRGIDANTTSAAGTPTIDGLGPVGGDDHAPAEWLDLSSVVPRVALLAGLISRV